MNKRVKAKWIAALRSGKYKQAVGDMRKGSGSLVAYCCLGVLEQLRCDETGAAFVSNAGVLSPEARKWAGLDSFNPKLGAASERGFEVWPDEFGSALTAVFTLLSDAELFLEYATRSDVDRIRNAAFEIAKAFPDLNYSDAPINPNGELVTKIARIIAKDFPGMGAVIEAG